MEESLEPRESAIICWPVEFLDEANPVPALHSTVLYWPIAPDKDRILKAARSISTLPIANLYRLATVEGVDAFGENKDYPVLKISSFINKDATLKVASLEGVYSALSQICVANALSPDLTFRYVPHVTVDLKTIINPPKQVLLRPLELWYKDDEPVKI